MRFALRGVPVELTALAVVGLLLGAGIAGYGLYDYTRQSATIDDAVAVEANVTEATVSERVGRRGVTYHANVKFTYEYEGSEYASERLYPTPISSGYGRESRAESLVEPYRTNETVTAYVPPSAPSDGFLIPRRSSAPLTVAGLGAALVALIALDAVGDRTAGRGTDLRPPSEREPTRYETLFGRDRDAVNALGKRLVAGGAAAFALSLVAAVLLLAGAEGTSFRVDPTEPLGLAAAVAGLGVLAVLVGLALYLVWSVTEYRRLRERIAPPRPPSPFRRPTRLVTILAASRSWEDLDPYGKRVARTAVAALALLIVGWQFAAVLLRAS